MIGVFLRGALTFIVTLALLMVYVLFWGTLGGMLFGLVGALIAILFGLGGLISVLDDGGMMKVQRISDEFIHGKKR